MSWSLRPLPQILTAGKRLPSRQLCRSEYLEHSASSRRPIHVSASLFKGGGKQNAKKNKEKVLGTAQAAQAQGIDSDVRDLSAVEKEFADAQSKMKEELGKLRSGGQFNHELLEPLRVSLAKDTKETVKLSDLATVLPGQGRKVLVVVGQEDHVKAISSTVLNSKFNLNPQVNPHNPLELQITLPPPTAESRKDVLVEADKASQKTLDRIRDFRGTHKKMLAALEKTKKARPDDVRKALTDLDKLVEKANKQVKETVTKAKAALEK